MSANAAAGLEPTQEQLNAQIEAWRTEQLQHVLEAMEVWRDPEQIALIFRIAADKAAPLARRRLALGALDALLAATDTTEIQRREALRGEITAEEHAAEADPKADAIRHVAQMREPFRLCYEEQLTREPGVGYKGSVKFTIEPNGEVSSVSTADLPEGLSSCIEAIVRASHFAPATDQRVVQFPLSLVASSPNAGVNPCLPYGPSIVELTGTLERRDYPGPPNYESVEQGDARETTWLLHLDKQACTLEGADASDPPRVGLGLMQLVFANGARDYDKYRSLMGKHILARGTLFGAQTAHHHTCVLLTVSELTAAK